MNRLARTGYLPSPPDWHADGAFDAAKVARASGETIVPGALKLPVYDQGPLGSCVANAWCAALELVMPEPIALSRLALYFACRALDDSLPADAGTTAQTAYEVLRDIGVPPESEWPYVVEKANANPPLLAREHAWDHRIDAAHRIVSVGEYRLDDVCASIAAGRPVTIGGPVSKAYEAYFDTLDSTPLAWDAFSTSDGGHEQVIVGFLPGDSPVFLVRNSWSDAGGLASHPGHAWYRASAIHQLDELFSVYCAPRYA